MSVVSSVLVPYTSYLRIYEPLAAFAEPERSHWARYARREDLPTAQDELRRSLADLASTPPVGVPVHESGDAFVAELGGVVCVCPWRTRLRGWLALEELGGMFPANVLDVVLPAVVRGQAAADHERWQRLHPDARPWIRTTVWQVPVRWFVLFRDEEREYAAADGEGPGPVLRYRTPMVEARRRLARALRTLRGHVPEGPLTEGLVDVGRWLEEFHPRSLVELDYGGLVHALPAERLAGDRSAADVAEGLAALRDGDGEGAGEAYARLAERWRAVRDLQFTN
ncbi:hypothetical protein N7925_18860 [Streptomyces sp. CA-278952]|uniref:hypothetical protein n=1 Tax=unclassified Streptomyces TaxID=2593676 RepID=UPI002241FF82|nr:MULTISPECIES: hypothetical protein [unclassified Streptomyces]UZI30273.1 hypothetical protein OH133_20295 [Streptomyces sp. VB1]WDG30256.1 hypothetical protein N7925_18860 [Streptomyces sp. CA-278952]